MQSQAQSQFYQSYSQQQIEQAIADKNIVHIPSDISHHITVQNNKKDQNVQNELQMKFDFNHFILPAYDPLVISSTLSRAISDSTHNDNSKQAQGFKKWKIGNLLSQGKFADVYKAMHKDTGKIAAVKKILHYEQDNVMTKKQLSSLTKINHENIIKYIEHFDIGSQTYIFMEYVQMSLSTFIKKFGIPPINLYLKFAKQMLQAMDYLYKHKIFHKDLKCSNILIDGKGVIKISDFGCSKGFDQTLSMEAYMNGIRSFRGTVLWMPPQTLIKSQCNQKSDMWSLGCTFLEMATNRAPWSEKNFTNEMAAMWTIGNENEVPRIPQQLDEKIKLLIYHCLKRNAEQRATPAQLLEINFIKYL